MGSKELSKHFVVQGVATDSSRFSRRLLACGFLLFRFLQSPRHAPSIWQEPRKEGRAVQFGAQLCRQPALRVHVDLDAREREQERKLGHDLRDLLSKSLGFGV